MACSLSFNSSSPLVAEEYSCFIIDGLEVAVQFQTGHTELSIVGAVQLAPLLWQTLLCDVVHGQQRGTGSKRPQDHVLWVQLLQQSSARWLTDLCMTLWWQTLQEAVQQVAHMYQAYMHHVCFVISVVRYLFILYVTPILSSHHGLDVFRLNQLRLACAVGFVKKKKKKVTQTWRARDLCAFSWWNHSHINRHHHYQSFPYCAWQEGCCQHTGEAVILCVQCDRKAVIN